jgi:hypothetical protein
MRERPVRRALSVDHQRLWNTGSSAFADADGCGFIGPGALEKTYRLTLKNSRSSVADSLSPTAE